MGQGFLSRWTTGGLLRLRRVVKERGYHHQPCAMAHGWTLCATVLDDSQKLFPVSTRLTTQGGRLRICDRQRGNSKVKELWEMVGPSEEECGAVSAGVARRGAAPSRKRTASTLGDFDLPRPPWLAHSEVDSRAHTAPASLQPPEPRAAGLAFYLG